MRTNGKRSFLTIVCLAIFITGVVPIRAQEASTEKASTAEALPSVDQILDKYVAALGGKEAVLKISSRVAKGTLELDQMAGEATTEIYQKAPNKMFTDTESPSFGAYIRAYDGTKGWQDTPQTGLDDVTGGQLASLKRSAEFYGDINLKELFPKMSLKGKESVDGHDAYVVEAVAEDGSPETWYFDANTGLRVRIISQTEGPDGTTEVDTQLGDYREVDGIKYPFLIHQSLGMIAYTIRLAEVKQNVPIDDAKFAKPAAQ